MEIKKDFNFFINYKNFQRGNKTRKDQYVFAIKEDKLFIHFKNFIMRLKTNASVFLALMMSFLFIACNNEKKDDEPIPAETTTESSPVSAYDPAMDPVNVEAAFVTMMADTLGIKFYEVSFKPGDSVNFHTHPDNIIYVLEGGTAEITPKDGETQVVEFKTGMGLVGGPATHKGKIIGTKNLKLLVADVYRPRN